MQSLLAASLLSLLVAACGSGAKSGSGDKVDGKSFLALATAQAKRMGDPNPSLIGFESDHRSVSVLVGVHRPCVSGVQSAKCRRSGPTYLHARVDPKTGKALAFVPVSPPVVTGSTQVERALMRQIAASLGLDSRERISFAKPLWRPKRHPGGISVIYRGGPGSNESNWREEVAAILLQHSSTVPVISYANSGANPNKGRGWVWGTSVATNPRLYSLAEKVALAQKLIAAAQQLDGARVISLELSRSTNLALSVAIETNHPARYLKHDLKAVLNLIPEPTLVGSYLRVVDQHGNKILESGGTSRGFFVYVLPALEACSPIVHSEPWGYRMPPCPA